VPMTDLRQRRSFMTDYVLTFYYEVPNNENIRRHIE
jgi:hypothetical protein